ncbi:hypothetical protein LINPERPRIM_LOCUS29636 [Linum perenne]
MNFFEAAIVVDFLMIPIFYSYLQVSSYKYRSDALKSSHVLQLIKGFSGGSSDRFRTFRPK